MARRSINVSLPDTAPVASMGVTSGMRLHPNYSLNSIATSDDNPRRPDLTQAHINVKAVRALSRLKGESLQDFQGRLEAWTTKQGFSDEVAHTWHKLVILAVSIIERGGVIQPITLSDAGGSGDKAVLIAGERRYLASILGGMSGVNAILTRSGGSTLYESLIENTQRDDLSLSAVILTLQAMQSEQGETFSVTRIVQLTGFSRGRSASIHKALALPINHAIHRELGDGQITKVYHLKKRLDECDALNRGSISSDDDNQDARLKDESPDTEQKEIRPTQKRAKDSEVLDWGNIRAWLSAQTGNDARHWQGRIDGVASPKALAECIQALLDDQVIQGINRYD